MARDGQGEQPDSLESQWNDQFHPCAGTSPDFVVRLDRDGRIVALSPASRKVLGVAPEEVIHRHYLDFIDSDAQIQAEQSFFLLLGGASSLELTLQLKHRNDRRIWVEIRAVPWFDGEDVAGVQGIVRDISELKVRQDILRRTNRSVKTPVREQHEALTHNSTMTMLENLLNTTSAGIGILRHGRFQYLNEQLGRMIGYSTTALLGRHWRTLFVVESDESSVAGGLPWQSGLLHAAESRWRRADGSLLEVLFSVVPLAARAPSRAHDVSLTVLDITARKQTERQLRAAHGELKALAAELQATRQQLIQAERLGAIGSLAASIAHEFTNPLCGVRSVLERIARKSELVAADQGLMELALEHCDRMNRLIRDVRQFSRPFSDERKDFDLHRAIDSVLLLVNKHLKVRKAVVCRDFGNEPLMLNGSENQIKQVLLNLINNRGEALPETGGEIRIQTCREGEHIRIVLSDSGDGISEEHLPHLFEPFFTTKTAVKETGLGLAVSCGIIKAHGGDILVESPPGQETTFTVILPAGNQDKQQGERYAGIHSDRR